MGNWRTLLFFCLFMLVFAIVFQSIPPLVSFLVESLDINHAQAGALMSLFGLPGIFISIHAGIFADQFGAKKVGTIALVITLLGTILTLGSSFSILVVGRIIAGIGAMTISVVTPQSLSKRFAKADLGKVMGIFNSIMPLGTILTLNLFGLLAARTSWRIPIWLTILYSLVVLFLYHFKYPALSEKTNEKKESGRAEGLSFWKKLSPNVWLLGIIWLLYNAGAIAYLSFAGDYFISIGHTLNFSGFLSSLLMIGALLLSPLVGYVTDRFGGGQILMIIGCLGLGITIWFLPKTSLNPIYLSLLTGLFASTVPVTIFALLPNFLPPRQLGLGYGLLAALLNVGVLIGPFLVGRLYDTNANYFSGFNLMAGLLLLAGFLAIISRLSIAKELGDKNRSFHRN